MKDYKRIPLKHLKNCRDLGGYGCNDGKMVSFHRLYRSEVPDHLTTQEWNVIEAMGVKTIIDLRSENEQTFAPYIVPDFIERISYPLQQSEDSSVSFGSMDDSSLAKLASSAFAKSLADGYRELLEDRPENMVSLLELIGKKLKNGAVLYHCTAGKDRTGVLSAMIYLLCGVDDADIVADYQVSFTYQAGNPIFDLIPPEMKHLLDSKPETMKNFLEAAHSRDYLGLLQRHGLLKETLDWLREELTE